MTIQTEKTSPDVSENRRLDRIDVFRLLRAAVKQAGSQRAFCEMHAMSVSFLSDMINGRRPISPLTLSILGVREVRYFEFINPKGGENRG